MLSSANTANCIDDTAVSSTPVKPADLPLSSGTSLGPVGSFTSSSPKGYQYPETSSNVDIRRDSGYETTEEEYENSFQKDSSQSLGLNTASRFVNLETGLEKAQKT